MTTRRKEGSYTLHSFLPVISYWYSRNGENYFSSIYYRSMLRLPETTLKLKMKTFAPKINENQSYHPWWSEWSSFNLYHDWGQYTLAFDTPRNPNSRNTVGKILSKSWHTCLCYISPSQVTLAQIDKFLIDELFRISRPYECAITAPKHTSISGKIKCLKYGEDELHNCRSL